MSIFNNNGDMDAPEKEEALARELNNVISRFVKEYQVTYCEVIGVLAVIQSEIIHESFMEDEEDE